MAIKLMEKQPIPVRSITELGDDAVNALIHLQYDLWKTHSLLKQGWKITGEMETNCIIWKLYKPDPNNRDGECVFMADNPAQMQIYLFGVKEGIEL